MVLAGTAFFTYSDFFFLNSAFFFIEAKLIFDWRALQQTNFNNITVIPGVSIKLHSPPNGPPSSTVSSLCPWSTLQYHFSVMYLFMVHRDDVSPLRTSEFPTQPNISLQSTLKLHLCGATNIDVDVNWGSVRPACATVSNTSTVNCSTTSNIL